MFRVETAGPGDYEVPEAKAAGAGRFGTGVQRGDLGVREPGAGDLPRFPSFRPASLRVAGIATTTEKTPPFGMREWPLDAIRAASP